MEPLILATHIPKSLNYLARGDAFKNPVARFLLNQIHILPIYRFRDGFNNMRNNKEAMQNAIDILNSGRSFLVFVEGSTTLQYSYRPIQKGVSRIIYQMLDEDATAKVAIIPIGFNDSDMRTLGSSVFVNLAKPIVPHELYKTADSKPLFLKKLTKLISDKSQEQVPQLDNLKDETLLQNLVSIFPDRDVTFDQLKLAADHINSIQEDEKSSLHQQVVGFKQKLGKTSSDTTALFQSFSISQVFVLVLGAIPALLGRMIPIIPMFVAKKFADTVIKNSAFYMVNVFVVRFVLVGFFYIILFVILKLFGVGRAFFILFALALLGMYAIYYVRELKTVINLFRLRGKKVTLRNDYFKITNKFLK